jgi:hypothetical protein
MKREVDCGPSPGALGPSCKYKSARHFEVNLWSCEVFLPWTNLPHCGPNLVCGERSGEEENGSAPQRLL